MKEKYELVGLPNKKRKFEFLTGEGVYGDCALVDSILYVLYYFYISEDSSDVKVRAFDLGDFDGDENAYPSKVTCDNIHVGSLSVNDGYLILGSGYSAIFEVTSGDKVFSEYDDVLPCGWKKSTLSFFYGNSYVRQVDSKVPSRGLDVYDLYKGEVCSTLSFDLDFCSYLGDGLIAGRSPDGSFSVFSVEKSQNILQLGAEEYFNSEIMYEMCFSQFKNKLAVAYNDSVVVLDLDTCKVLHHLNFLNDERVQSLIEKFDTSRGYLEVSSVSFFDDKIVLSGGSAFSYVMCVDVGSEESSTQWLYQGFGDNHTLYAGGDLVFGIQEKRPVAWDVFSGEMIWKGSAGTIANKIQVGDGWLVYSAPAGYIQCFQWKKPYISPHRPSV